MWCVTEDDLQSSGLAYTSYDGSGNAKAMPNDNNGRSKPKLLLSVDKVYKVLGSQLVSITTVPAGMVAAVSFVGGSVLTFSAL